MNPAAHLAALNMRRRDWVRATRDNDFESGIRTLLTELYPDEAHFIYELLQNAEDARATSVAFELGIDGLVLSHDGRVFNADDVDSITQIGGSTKTDDVNQIGKFGVGFKAVFAYTETPRIFSGEYAFEVRDLVCPEPLASRPGTASSTRFEFPFNHPGKPAPQAYAETASGLRSLATETLLFLTHIREITWCVEEDAAYGRLERVGEDQGRIMIVREGPGGESPATTEWLRFQSPLQDKPKLNVAVAFPIEKLPPKQSAEGHTGAASGERIAQTDGKVFLFFPADKEFPQLRFHIHGPYSSTVARDSIRHGDAGNQRLLAETADLIVSSLPAIRDMGLLTTDFLATLPNKEDEMASFYAPVREAIITALQSEALVPAQAGGHVSARELVQGPRRIKDTITDDLLPFFLSTGTAKKRRWAAGALDNRRESLLLDSLGIETWGWEQLGAAVHHHFGQWAAPAAAEWLAARPDEWMHRFYALLEAALFSQRVSVYTLQQCVIVRLAGGKHVRASAAYFPRAAGAAGLGSSLAHVKPEVLAGRNRERVEKVSSFLTRLGVKTAGEREEIEAILDAHYRESTPNPGAKDHIGHLRRFIRWWREHDAEVFEGTYLFRGGDGQGHYPSSVLYIDSPHEQTGLTALLEGDERFVLLWPGYTSSKITGLEDFAAAVGVIRRLRIEENQILSNHPDYAYLHQDYWGTKKTHRGVDQDFTIPELPEYLNRATLEGARCVWDAVVAAPKYQQLAQLQPNASIALRSRPSTLVYELRNRAWLPDKEGSFHRPGEITLGDLHPSFRRDDPNGWLEAIRLGESVQQRQQAYQARLHAAESIGVPVEIADRLAGLAPDERTKVLGEILDLFERRGRVSFPERESANPARRSARVAAVAAESPVVEYERRNRSVRVSDREVRTEAREYLRDLYTNNDGVMVCQICEQEMSFRLPAGEYYFETVELVALGREHRPNYLALCPICAAKFKHANATGDEEIRNALEHGEDAKVDLVLAGRPGSIRFVGNHFADIRAVLSTELDD